MSNSNIESFQAFLLEQYQEYTREQIIVKQSILSKYQDYFDGISKNIFIIKKLRPKTLGRSVISALPPKLCIIKYTS